MAIRPRYCLQSLVICLLIAPAVAQDKQESPNATAAINQSAKRFTTAFKKENAKAIAKLWTPSGVYVDETGAVHEGREAIQAVYQQFFDSHDGAEIEITIDSVRQVAPNVAVEAGTAKITPPPIGAPASSKYVAVHVKQDNGKWLLDSVRDTRVEIPSNYDRLVHLELLVGEWVAEHNGARIELTGQWNPNKTFLERRFVVTQNGTETASTEIIGWDPSTAQVTSWTFSADGARNVGRWKALDDGWIVRNQGVTAEGVSTTSVDFWAPLLDDALGWRSTKRSAGGTALAAPDEVVLKKTDAAASKN